ncbi:InlB B-repeat-containing protein [Porphyromonas endodontalis]|uniref:InlB B-repeat-containing protein n=1 Tax=Porphyromonas endodontalis TaxID=28124 RepID=UPI0028E23F3A|nr:T9SS type A sorting domain-containing protein [Porphyromonas endodontalis]
MKLGLRLQSLVAWALSLALVTIALPQLNAQNPVITLKTSKTKGERLLFNIYPKASFTIEGVKANGIDPETKKRIYILDSEDGKISISGPVLYLDCSEGEITSLDVSKNTKLEVLDCSKNNLSSLDVSKNTNIGTLNCSNNKLSSLSVSKNTVLDMLNCSNNGIASLDLSKNTALFELLCSNNKLTSLDLSKHNKLQEVHCDNNQLSSLIVSKQATDLIEVRCTRNQIQGASMDALIASLPKINKPRNRGVLAIYDNSKDGEHNTCTSAQTAAAKERGWVPYTYNRDTKTWIEYSPAMFFITYAQPSNGVLTVKDGASTIASQSSVEIGTQLTVVATANQGYELEALMINNKKVENPTFDPALRTYKANFTTEKATTISATFKRKIEKVTITYKPATNGNLVVKKGANTLASGTSVEKGTQLIVVATANQGYELEALMINNKKVENPTFDPTLRTYKANFTAEKATTISATFKRKIEKVTITYKPATNGSLVVKQGANTLASGASVEKGTQLTVVATANQGYELEALMINNKRVENPTFDPTLRTYKANFTAEKATTISATFKRKIEKVTITYKPTTNGSLVVKQGANTLASGTSVEKGTQLAVVATANQGHELKNGKVLLGNEELVLTREGQVYTGTFVAEASVEISAEFIATTALSAIDSPSILVYPNPASHKVQISNANPNSEVALYNMDGLLLQQATTNAEGEVTLHVATLPTGHYLVRTGSSSVLVDIRR